MLTCMKYLLTTFLLAGFVSIAVFGIFGMHAGMQNHDGGCGAAIAQGTDCPKQSASLEYLTFHLDAFRGFSTVVFGENIMASLLTFVLLVIGAGTASLLGNLTPPQLDLAYSHYKQHKNFSSSSQRQLLRWFALHENSPATL